MKRALTVSAALTALASCHPAYAQNRGLTSLTPHGTPAATDVIPIQPAAGTTLLSSKVSDLQGFVVNDVRAFGAVGDGVTDDTAAIQSAINAGGGWTCNGIYKTSSTLNLITLATTGEAITGSATQGVYSTASAPTSGRCTIQPTSAVTTAFKIDGISFGGYVTNVAIRNITLDMTNMPNNSVGFLHGQSFDNLYDNIRVIGDTAKTAWKFGPGAFLTTISNSHATLVYCLGTGVQNPTTVTLINDDLFAIGQEQCANLTTIGGAVQPAFGDTGTNTVVYIPPGTTNLLGNPSFYATTQALNAANGLPNGQGMYAVLGGYTLNAQNLTSVGTDWEAQRQLASTCPTGGTWTGGSTNDGTHGCLPAVWAIQVGSFTIGCSFDNPVFHWLYLYQPTSQSCDVRGSNTGAFVANDVENANHIFNRPVTVNAGQAIFGYSDPGSTTRTFLLDASTGGLANTSIVLKPLLDGQSLTLENSAGTVYMICTSNAAIQFSNCGVGYGADWTGYSDGFITQTYDFNSANGNATFAGSLTSPRGLLGSAYIEPALDANDIYQINNAAGANVQDCGTSVTIGLSYCAWNNGINLTGYAGASFTSPQWSLGGSTGAILSYGVGGIGFSTGAGGAVTQATSRTTGVTLNKQTGAITLFPTTTTIASIFSFTVTDSVVAATDTIKLDMKTGTTSATQIYIPVVTAVATGSFQISVYTPAAMPSEGPVINFTVMKGAAS